MSHFANVGKKIFFEMVVYFIPTLYTFQESENKIGRNGGRKDRLIDMA